MSSSLRRRDPADQRTDVIAQFYDRHPYPPPANLDAAAPRSALERRAAHHLLWPARPVPETHRVLVAGCGTSQAVRHALLDPTAEVVGIDVSARSLEHSRRLVARHGVTNLELRRLPIEDVAALGARFDHIVCTGVLHHLADPAAGLQALRGVLAPGGAVTLMVYAPYGRAGVYLLQDYCRRLGVSTETADIADLVATLREIPPGHPISPLLRGTRDFADDDALADALLNPRDRAYSVPQLLELLEGAGLRMRRWARQAPYLPDCGSISETPHGRRIAELPAVEQHAALELFRGTMLRHTVLAAAADDPGAEQPDPTDPELAAARPIPSPTALAVQEKDRLPPGIAAALLNRAHTETDLVLFVDAAELALFRRIDGERTIAALGPGAPAFVRRLLRHDLVVLDASECAGMAP
ncbi:class I SAM-dependent methyltransferase [Brachybacterium sp. YJGR34]|uniref:class I SAM-dependent methyltransferase n=1 Tax=Brachybacterium sp. YJGR34 TaxID=2059911 RepID=UPI000E0B1A9C|nr:class I SAM-dependent methyltransferase [Brachybacterium sp. YJGR34]